MTADLSERVATFETRIGAQLEEILERLSAIERQLQELRQQIATHRHDT